MPVVAVTMSQVVDPAGNLSDVYEITYTITNRPGSFTFTVTVDANAVSEAQRLISEQIAQIEAIYGIGT